MDASSTCAKKTALSEDAALGKLGQEERKREREKRTAVFFGNSLNLVLHKFGHTGIAALSITRLPCRNSTSAIPLKEVSGRPMLKHIASHRVTLEIGGCSFTAVSHCKGQAMQSMQDLHNQTSCCLSHLSRLTLRMGVIHGDSSLTVAARLG